jgi:hypothetical protein
VIYLHEDFGSRRKALPIRKVCFNDMNKNEIAAKMKQCRPASAHSSTCTPKGQATARFASRNDRSQPEAT